MMNKTTGNFKRNSQLKSSVYATIRVTSSPTIKSKISKLMPFKKVAVELRKQGTWGPRAITHEYVENSDPAEEC